MWHRRTTLTLIPLTNLFIKSVLTCRKLFCPTLDFFDDVTDKCHLSFKAWPTCNAKRPKCPILLFIGNVAVTGIEKAECRVGKERKDQCKVLCLCKRPPGDSHFRGHVSPMICNMWPFFFYVTCADTWFSDFFPFFDRSGCVYPPKVNAYKSLSSFN